MVGMKNYTIKKSEVDKEIRVDVSYNHEFSESKINEFIVLSEDVFIELFVRIKKMLTLYTGKFEMNKGDLDISVSYGGPDYQPVVKIFVERGESIQGIAIPEQQCLTFIDSLSL